MVKYTQSNWEMPAIFSPISTKRKVHEDVTQIKIDVRILQLLTDN